MPQYPDPTSTQPAGQWGASSIPGYTYDPDTNTYVSANGQRLSQGAPATTPSGTPVPQAQFSIVTNPDGTFTALNGSTVLGKYNNRADAETATRAVRSGQIPPPSNATVQAPGTGPYVPGAVGAPPAPPAPPRAPGPITPPAYVPGRATPSAYAMPQVPGSARVAGASPAAYGQQVDNPGAQPATDVTSAAPAPFASVDYSSMTGALTDLQNTQKSINEQLARLSGIDPFGNEAFLRSATDRAQATALGTAAAARGGPAALAGANRVALGAQSAMQAQATQQLLQQRAQDQVQAAGVRAQLTGQQAGLTSQLLSTSADLTKAQTQAVSQNLQAWLDRYKTDAGLSEQQYETQAKLFQDNADSIRNAAVAYAQIDQQRYATDAQYRESVDRNIIDSAIADKQVKGQLEAIRQQQKLTFKDLFTGLLGAGGTAAGALVSFGGGGSAPAPRPIDTTNPYSDRRVKTDVRDPDLADLAKFLETKAYRYRYKTPSAPGMAAGEQFGPMAQDLARSRIGASVVKADPDGKLRVDTGRLALADHAALTHLAREVEKLKGKRRRG